MIRNPLVARASRDGRQGNFFIPCSLQMHASGNRKAGLLAAVAKLQFVALPEFPYWKAVFGYSNKFMEYNCKNEYIYSKSLSFMRIFVPGMENDLDDKGERGPFSCRYHSK
jgi:hypothetical protein